MHGVWWQGKIDNVIPCLSGTASMPCLCLPVPAPVWKGRLSHMFLTPGNSPETVSVFKIDAGSLLLLMVSGQDLTPSLQVVQVSYRPAMQKG